MPSDEYSTAEYETLAASEREVAGNQEQATIAHVAVDDRQARLTFEFDWQSDRAERVYDLDSERDVLKLKVLTRSKGYDFDQIPYLEDETVTVAYIDGEWVPAATLPDVEANVLTDTASATAEPGILERTYGTIGRRIESATTQEIVVAAIVLKKILIATAIVYVLVNL